MSTLQLQAGIVVDDIGQRFPINYHLLIQRTGRSVLRTTSGRIVSSDPWFAFDHLGQIMTLELADSRRMRFFFRNSDGEIALNKWLDS